MNMESEVHTKTRDHLEQLLATGTLTETDTRLSRYMTFQMIYQQQKGTLTVSIDKYWHGCVFCQDGKQNWVATDI